MIPASRRLLASLMGSSIYLTTSALCLACVFDGDVLDRDASLGVIGLTAAQLPIAVLQYFYAQSLRAGRTPRERVRHFGRQGALILILVAMTGGPYLTIPDAALGVLWALFGVVTSLFAAGGDVELEARRASALAEDALTLFGMVARLAWASASRSCSLRHTTRCRRCRRPACSRWRRRSTSACWRPASSTPTASVLRSSPCPCASGRECAGW